MMLSGLWFPSAGVAQVAMGYRVSRARLGHSSGAGLATPRQPGSEERSCGTGHGQERGTFLLCL